MWEHHTDDKSGWKYSVTSNKFIVQITGGSITVLDKQTEMPLKRYKGHHYLYTGDISLDETQCFALENGKHFYVYSLENYELIKRVTLPRGYECIDMYGHYAEDGTQICIPVKRWVGNKVTCEGSYEYVMCQYDAQQLTLMEMTTIEDPEIFWWVTDVPAPTLDEDEMAHFQEFLDTFSANKDNKDFVYRMLGFEPKEDIS